ncbi:oxygenase MpaB family protein [Rhodococcus sp. NPDC003318]|uniref:oxygenase MpaB family protein n=1 Tax=Rhodococcus sp. NPDC003318 TaxID=3364503 RepID=UPI0036C43682
MTTTATGPTRYMRDRAKSARVTAPLRPFAWPAPDATPSEAAQLRRALLARDEPSAALVRAVREDRTVTLAQFRQALAEGVDAVPDAPAPLREYFALLEDTPAWVDREKIALGARTLRRVGSDVGDVLAYGSLLGGYNNSGPLPVLTASGRLTGERTRRRIAETGTWWNACVADGGLDRFGDGFTLSVHVRLMHAFVDYHHEHETDWDSSERGLPVNQFDQAGTLGLFSITFLLHTRVLGMRYTRREADAVLHLWCYVGWLMGVDPRWLPFDERAGLRMMYQIGASSPAADEHSYALARSLVDLPLHTRYPRFARLRRRYEYERGLSLATTLLGPAGVRALRVPVRPPWYPAGRIAVNIAKHHVVGRFPAGKRHLQRLGERQLHRDRLRVLGGEIPDVAPIPH